MRRNLTVGKGKYINWNVICITNSFNMIRYFFISTDILSVFQWLHV